MSHISHISVMSIPVSDQDRAKAFYADALGFEVLADEEFAPGRRWVQLAPAGAQTSITLTTWFDDYPPGTVRGNILDVDDLAATKAECSQRGVEFPEEDMATPWGRFAAFADPDGNRWSFREPPASER